MMSPMPRPGAAISATPKTSAISRGVDGRNHTAIYTAIAGANRAAQAREGVDAQLDVEDCAPLHERGGVHTGSHV